MVELIGYLGSVLVVVSMLMSSVVKLRVINTIGSGIFAGYALLIHSYPTALMNACLVGINLYNLVRLRQGDRSYDLAETAPEDGLLRFLLARYREDIRKYFPGFVEQRTADRAYVVFCGGDPAGILLGTVAGQGTLKVTLDYSTPAYRDCSIGTYLYGKLPSKGVHTLIFGEEESQDHAAYLTRMGFSRENGVFVKHLD
ncbi:YgjV family protein [Lawsonibacter sp. JLR.KK007]|uniref:YgjV family protein n=1 Tax=Lawsonibacter sp. JLR.KK007 TaxID=3114293 RepID=UPI002FEE6727